jgi:hypothetical protein
VKLDHEAADQAPALIGAEDLGELERLRPESLRLWGRRIDVDDVARRHPSLCADGLALCAFGVAMTIKVAERGTAGSRRARVRILGQVESDCGDRRDPLSS